MKYLSLKQNTDDLKDALINETFMNGGGVALLQDSNKTVYDPVMNSSERNITISSTNISDSEGNPIREVYSFVKPPFLFKKESDTSYDTRYNYCNNWTSEYPGSNHRIYYKYNNDVILFDIYFYEGSNYTDRVMISLFAGSYTFKNISFNF